MEQESTFLGRPRWQVTLAIMFLSQMLNAVSFSLVFPFLPLYVQDLGSVTGLSVEMMAGLVIAVQGFTMMLASPFWGAFADRYGRKLMVLRATFGGTIIMGLMGVVRNGEQLILLRGLQGVITGTVAANNALVAAATPREHIGFAMGSMQVGLWGGVAVGPILGGILADAYGFAMPFYVTAVGLLLSGLLVFFGIDEQFDAMPNKKKKTDEPQPNFVEQWQHVMAAEGVKLLYILRFVVGVGRMMIIPIAPLFVVSLLPPENATQSVFAGSVIAVSSATSTFSGVYLGRLGDNIGHRIILVWAAVGAMVFYVPQVFVVNVWQLLVLQGLAGLALGGLASSLSALLANYTEQGEEGSVYGLDNAIVAGSRALAPLVGAWIALYFGMRGTFAATAIIFLFVSVTTYFFLPQPKIEKKMKTAVAAGD